MVLKQLSPSHVLVDLLNLVSEWKIYDKRTITIYCLPSHKSWASFWLHLAITLSNMLRKAWGENNCDYYCNNCHNSSLTIFSSKLPYCENKNNHYKIQIRNVNQANTTDDGHLRFGLNLLCSSEIDINGRLKFSLPKFKHELADFYALKLACTHECTMLDMVNTSHLISLLGFFYVKSLKSVLSIIMKNT